MATVAKNYKRFSKIYIVNSDYNTNPENKLYSINVDAGEIKKAYYRDSSGNMDLIYNSEGQGYWLGAYILDPEDNNSYIFFPNPEVNSSYVTVHFNSYLTTTVSNYNRVNPSANTDWITYNWETGESSRIYLDSYFRNTSGVRAQDVTIQNKPNATVSYEIQHRLINTSALSSYSYQWNTSTRQIQGNGHQKIWYRVFQPRRAYFTTFGQASEYGGLKRRGSNSTWDNINMNIFYNVDTQMQITTGNTNSNISHKDKYLYRYISAYNDPINPSTDTEAHTYYYERVNNHITTPSNTAALKGDRQVLYAFNCIHSSYNGYTYYPYGMGKTISRRITAYLNSYEQVNSYTTAIKETHDSNVSTFNSYIMPYILLDIDFYGVPSGDTNYAEDSNWEDIYCGIYMNPIGSQDIYRLEANSNWTYLNNIKYGEWEKLIDDANYSLRDHNGYPQKQMSVSIRARTSSNYPEYHTWYDHYLGSLNTGSGSPDYRYAITSILPPVRDFPYDDERIMNYINNDDTATYTEALNRRFFLYGCTYESVLSAYDGSKYDHIVQWTPDIDGKNEYTEDFVMRGCEYTQTDYTTGETVTERASGTPYDYSGGFYTMVPWYLYDSDINLLIVNKNCNYTPTSVEYSVTVEWDGGQGRNVYYNRYVDYEDSEKVGGIHIDGGLKGAVFEHVHNVKVNHDATTRGGYDSWNHIGITFYQEASGSCV